MFYMKKDRKTNTRIWSGGVPYTRSRSPFAARKKEFEMKDNNPNLSCPCHVARSV